MPRNILVVDDNIINRQLLKKVLGGDYNVWEAENGKAALKLIRAQYADLSAVLTDIVMPEMNGYELLQAIRGSVRFPALPVIMVTGSEDEASRLKALTMGANDFIVKPFSPEIIRHCVKNNIALRETAAALDSIRKDKLTGLYSREAFFDKVSAAVREHAPGYYILSCFDIDNFKLINDQFGAMEGDRILREVGRAVSEDMASVGGVGGRISGDHFAVLLPYMHKEMSITRLVQQNRMVFSDKQALVFSIGRYVVNDLSLPASALYDRAYIAKLSIKGRYDEHIAYFNDAMLDNLIRGQQIIADMDEAIARRQFEIWFQPQHNHTTGALVGTEALVRWRHPDRGLIPPGDFIPLFEQNGFIYELDKYVWEEACRCLRKWTDEGRNPTPVSVNISRYDLFRADFLSSLTGLIKKYAIPVGLLRLEITESAFSKTTRQVVDIVKQLVQHGFTVEIDDFGSGYSSLNTLKNVPAQVVKLDMRFLQDDDDSGRGGNILESIVRMSKWLNMSVIAEGVEDKEQADYLASIGCSYIQGYLYARPMPESDYEAYCQSAGKEKHLLTMNAVAHLDNLSFWNPKSMDTLIFNSFVGAACIFEYHGHAIELLRVNAKFPALLGDISVEDVLRLDWLSCLTPESLKLVRGILQKSAETGEEYTGEYLLLNLSPACQRTFLRSTMRVIATAGERMLVYCTSENITPQRLAEENQRIAEARSATIASQLKIIMDNVSCGITAVTYNGEAVCCLAMNNRFPELLGYTREEYEAVGFFAPIHEADRPRVVEKTRQAYVSGKPFTMEYRANKKNGGVIWLRQSATATRFDGNEMPVQLSIFTDITAEKHAAFELLDNLPSGAGMYEYTDGCLYVTYLNQSYWQLVKQERTEYTGLPVLSAIHPDDTDALRRELTSAINQRRDAVCDLRLRHYGNTYYPVHLIGRIVSKGNDAYTIYTTFTPM